MPPQLSFDSRGVSLLGVVAFWTIFYVWVGGEAWIGLSRRLPSGVTSEDRGSMSLVIGSVCAGLVLGFILAVKLPGARIIAGGALIFGAGLALMVTGILLRWYAVRVLGSAFTVTVGVRADQGVVERGPYRWVRHPSYTGGLLTIAGVLLCCTNIASLAAIVLPLAGYAYRIRIEERALVASLGDTYRAYMRRTRRLIPFVL